MIKSTLVSEEQLKQRIKQMGEQIRADYENQEVVLVGVLKGAMLFLTDLARELDPQKTEIDFLQCSSYEGTKSTGKVKLELDISTNLDGKHVIIVEDLIETGTTLKFLKQHILAKNPESVKICALLDKQLVEHDIDYIGFNIPADFVIGYGLDYNEKYRNLKYIGIFDESTIK